MSTYLESLKAHRETIANNIELEESDIKANEDQILHLENCIRLNKRSVQRMKIMLEYADAEIAAQECDATKA